MSRVLPILFNADMVRAILDGRKTVTRRRVKFLENRNPAWTGYIRDGFMLYNRLNGLNIPCCKMPPYQKGDIVYVRETWFYEIHMENLTAGEPDLPSGRYSSRYIYKADDSDYPVSVGVGGTGWRPSIHMPKEAARIWLKITDVRVERLQNMVLDDFLSEGVCINPEAFNDPENAYGQAKRIFTELWNSTIKKPDQDLYGWDANPWVWVIEFERCEKPKEEKRKWKTI